MTIALNFIMYVLCLLIGYRMGFKRGFASTMTKIWLMDNDAHRRILTEIRGVLVRRGVNVDEQAFNDIVKDTDTEQETDRKDDN